MEHYSAQPLLGSEPHRHAATPCVLPMGLPRRCDRGLDDKLLEPLSRVDGAAPVVAMQLPLIAMARPAQTVPKSGQLCARRAKEHHQRTIKLFRISQRGLPCMQLE